MTRTPEAGAITYDGRNRAQTIEVQSGWRRVYDTANRLVWRVGPPNVHTGHDGPDLLLDFYLPDGRKLGTYQRFVSSVPAPPGETPAPAGIYFSRNEEHVYFGGRLIKTETMVGSVGTTYTRQDRLGATTGHYPYGEQRTASTSPVKFATYWHDHGGLQYAQNRYYSATYGRFTTPDPYRASGGPSDPRSWNRYAYVEGDPVNLNDPEGLISLNVSAFMAPPSDFSVTIFGGGGSDTLLFRGAPGIQTALPWIPVPNPGGACTDPATGLPCEDVARLEQELKDCGKLPDAITASGSASAGALLGMSGFSFDAVFNARSGASTLLFTVTAGGGFGSGAGASVMLGLAWNSGSQNENHARGGGGLSITIPTVIPTPLGLLDVSFSVSATSVAAGIGVGIRGLNWFRGSSGHGTHSQPSAVAKLSSHSGQFVPGYGLLRSAHDDCRRTAGRLGRKW